MRNRRWKQRRAYLLACGEGNRQRAAFRRELLVLFEEALRRYQASNRRAFEFLFGDGASPWSPP